MPSSSRKRVSSSSQNSVPHEAAASLDLKGELELRIEDLSTRRPSTPHLVNLQLLLPLLSRKLSSQLEPVLASYSTTILDLLVNHSVKSRTAENRFVAIRCLSAFFVQISNLEDVDLDDYPRVFDVLVDIATGCDMDARLRAEALRALTVGDLMLNEDFELRRRLIGLFLDVFVNVKVTSGSGHANRNGECSIGSEIVCTSSLDGYGCTIPSLLSEDSSFAIQSICSFFTRCSVLLKSSSVLVRTATCSVLSIIAEQANLRRLRAIRVPPHICETVTDLANEVSKRVQKKGLNVQKNGFKRLQTLLETQQQQQESTPTFTKQTIKLYSHRRREIDLSSTSDCLVIDSFHKECCYGILSEVLGSHLIEHLRTNEAVRAMLGVHEPPLDTDDSDTGESNEIVSKNAVNRFQKAKNAQRHQKIGRDRDAKNRARNGQELGD